MRILSAKTRRSLLKAFGLCLTLLAAPVPAIEVTGTVTADLAGPWVLPGIVEPVPIKGAQVHLGLLEADTIYTFLSPSWSTHTDENGEFTINLGDDDPPWVPAYVLPYVLVVVLDSEAGGAAVFDHERDADNAACLSTRSFDVANRGVTEANIQLLATRDKSSSYSLEINGGDPVSFEPVADRVTTFAGTTRCTASALTELSELKPYDTNGLTNTDPARFAQLAVHYARAYNAYEMVRDGLGKDPFPKVRIETWHPATPGDCDDSEFFYQCASDAADRLISLGAPQSEVWGDEVLSSLYDLRHEYGHHFMCSSAIGGEGALPPLPAGDDNHGNLMNSTSSDSWVEGFATFFAAAVAAHHKESRPPFMYVTGCKKDATNTVPQRTTVPHNIAYSGAELDDPFTAGEQLIFGSLAEEDTIASLLWGVSDTVGWDALIGVLDDSFIPLDNFYRVYLLLRDDYGTASPFDTLPCYFPETDTQVFGLDCLFIDRGFYDDLNEDGLYGGAEQVGSTRWPLDSSELSPKPRRPQIPRPNRPPLEGSQLRVSAVDEFSLMATSVEGFHIQIVYDPPLDDNSLEYTVSFTGEGPWEFSILVPGVPSRAVVTPVKPGYVADAPLVIESGFFHERVNPFRPGGIDPFLAEHSFRLRPDNIEGPLEHFTCGDGLDNDGDGLTDGDDPDCAAQIEICDNQLDDDGDGQQDCADVDCDGFAGAPGSCVTSVPGICSSGTPVCDGAAARCVQDELPVPEALPGESICVDGLDNDCDGLVDGADDGCSVAPGDVYLTKLKVPNRVNMKVGKPAAKRTVDIRGDAALIAQDATVRLAAVTPAGVEVSLHPAAITKAVEPGGPDTKFRPFAVTIGCTAPGEGTIEWTATIDAVSNDDILNDTLSGRTTVSCR